MKKISIIMLALFMSISTFNLIGCDDVKGFNINIVLVDGSHSIISKYKYCSMFSGLDVSKPSEEEYIDKKAKYKYITSGYYIVDEEFYLDQNLTQIANFPMEMPHNDLNLYCYAQPLTPLSNINLIDCLKIEKYFSNYATLKDEYGANPDVSNATAYYEISENSKEGVSNMFRYYPANKKLILFRGYSVNQNLAVVIVQDTFSAGISIDFSSKTYKFSGVYIRIGASPSYSTAVGTVNITYLIDGLNLTYKSLVTVPNYNNINYSVSFSNYTNYSKLKELWDSDGKTYSEKCYSEFNALLRSICNRIQIFV